MTVAPQNEHELVEALKTAPSAALPASAPARWLLLVLHRHRQRQAWVGQIVDEQLRGNLTEIGRYGALEHPEHVEGFATAKKGSGPVPGVSTWTYYFHGVGCCLTHEDGTSIDVDFVDGQTDWIDPYFYLHFLDSLPAAELVEARLIRPGPISGYWKADLPALREAGLIELAHRIRVTDEGARVATALEAALDGIEASDNRWAAAWKAITIGDAALAAELLGQRAPPSLLELVEQQRSSRSRWLHEQLGGAMAAACLKALAELGRSHAEQATLAQLEREPVDRVVSAALELIGLWGDERHVPALVKLVARAGGTEIPAPHVRSTAAEIVMRLVKPDTISSELRQQLLQALEQPSGASDGEAGFLVTLLDHDRGVERLRAALASPVPHARMEAACALALIATDEAMFELRRSEVIQAQTIMSVLRGEDVEAGPAPVGETITWRGRPKRVYRIDELMLQSASEWAVTSFEGFRRRFGELRERWFGH